MADRLAQYIKQHGSYAFTRGDRLYAIESGTQRHPNGTITGYTALVEIPATLVYVRLWLGY